MAQIEMIIDSVRRNSLTDQWSIILKERGAERYLPIYAGSPQASLVAKQLQAASHNWWKFDLAISYTLLPSQSILLSNQCFL